MVSTNEKDIGQTIHRETLNRLINDAFKWTLVLFIPAVIAQFLIIKDTGFQPVMVYILISAILASLVVLFRKRLSYGFRTTTYIIMFFILGVGAFFNYGLVGAGAWWFTLVVSLSALLYPKRIYHGLIILIVSILLVCAILVTTKILVFPFDIETFAYSPYAWFASVMAIAYTILVIAKSIEKITSSLRKTQTELLERNDNLYELNQKLEEEIETRRSLRENLLDSEELHRLTLTNISDAVLITNDHGEFTFVGPNANIIFGFTDTEILKMGNISKLLGTDIFNPGELQTTGEIRNIEREVKVKRGLLFTLLINVKKVSIRSGTILYSCHDISERKNAKIALQESREWYRTMFESAGDAVFIVQDSTVIDCNKKTEELFQWNKYKMIGLSPWDISPEYQPNGQNSRQGIEEIVQTIKKDEPVHLEWQHKKCNGELFDAEISLNLIDPESHQYIVILRDITERKKAQKALVASEERYRTLFKKASDPITLHDEYQILEINQRVVDLLGYTHDDIIGKHPVQLSPEYQPDGELSATKAELRIMRCLEGVPQLFEWQLQKLDGNPLDLEVSLTKLEFAKEKNLILALWRDLTERNRMQRRIYNARVEAEERERERFAKELHDGLGPILSTVKFNFEWLSENTGDDKREKIIQMGNNNIQEAFVTLRDISNNLNPHILTNYGLTQAIKSFIVKSSSLRSIHIDFQTNTESRFRTELEIALYRIIQELVNNTIKYAKAKNISIWLNKTETANTLILKYKDDGVGFDLKTRLDSKEGFGLFNIQNRIKLLDGNISMKSKPGKGFHLEIELKL